MATNSAYALLNALDETKNAERILADLAAQRGITYSIAQPWELGVRSQSDTTRYISYRANDYARYVKSLPAGTIPTPIEAWRRIAPFGNSYHNYGGAFDITIVSKPAAMSSEQALAVVGSLAEQAGLRWGHSFGDDPHFELLPPLETIKTLWISRGNVPGVAHSQMGAASLSLLGVLAVGALLFLGFRK